MALFKKSTGGNMTGINGYAIRAMNLTADMTEAVFSRSYKTIIPTSLGAIGGWMANVGAPMGGFQGCCASLMTSWILRPAKVWVDNNSGRTDDQLHENTRNVLYVAGTIAEIAVPVFLTLHFGERIMSKIADHAPALLHNLLAPALAENYSVMRGLLVNILPPLVSLYIEGCLENQKRENKQR
jgi:hypothetical protein